MARSYGCEGDKPLEFRSRLDAERWIGSKPEAVGIVLVNGTAIGVTDPIGYLTRTHEDYHAVQRAAERYVLPLAKRDQLVSSVLQKFQKKLREHKESLEGKAAGALIYGSFLFGDPSNDPDLDFALVYVCDSSKSDISVSRETIERVLQSYERDFEPEANASHLDLTQYELDLAKVAEGNYTAMQEPFFLMDTSLILFAKQRYLKVSDKKKVQEKLESIKEKIHDIARKDPMFRGLVTAQFEKIIDSRKRKRRPARRTGL